MIENMSAVNPDEELEVWCMQISLGILNFMRDLMEDNNYE